MRTIRLGRDIHNDCVVPDPFASAFHCQITQHDNGVCTIADTGSKNGTYVNGIRIFGEIQLRPTDIVRIGNSTPPWQTCLYGSGRGGRIVDPFNRPGPGFGITALCCGVLGISIPAVVFGAIAMHRNERLRGLGITGLVLGILGVVFNVILIILAIAGELG